MLNYYKALIKCVRTIYSQVEVASPEPATEPCHCWEHTDWVHVKVDQLERMKRKKT